MTYLLIIGWFIIAWICAFDNYSTYLIIQDGGLEINPIMNWLMSKWGVANALTFSKLICLLILGHGIYGALRKPLEAFKLRIIAFSLISLIGFYSVIMYFFNFQYMLERNLL